METSFFLNIYKKRRKRRIIGLSIGLIIVLIIVAIAGFKYYGNLYNPTVVKTADDYNKAAAKDKYIVISTDKIYDLNLVMTETSSSTISNESSSNPKEYIEAVKLNDKLLIVSIPIDKYNSSFANKKGPFLIKGTATRFDDKDYETLKESLKSSSSKITDSYLDSIIIPKYLEYESPFSGPSIFLIFAGLILAFVLLINIPIMFKNRKALKQLEKFSNGNLQAALDEIDSEIMLDDVCKVDPIIITKNYIIIDTSSTVLAMPKIELMWAYKNITTNKVNGIPVGKTNKLKLIFSDGSQYEFVINIKKQNFDQILVAIHDHCSKTIVGFSNDLNKLFQKNRKEFINQWNRSING